MMSTFAEGVFWSKKSIIPSGAMVEEFNTFTFNNFKLHKEGNSTFNKSGTKERT